MRVAEDPFPSDDMTTTRSEAPRISVIVAARDAETTLEPCLRALCEQLGRDGEAILVDDDSNDSTAEIAARFPVSVLSLEDHRGVAGARNRGAREAKAPILLFLDADTVPAPQTVIRVLELMSDPEIGAVIGSYDDEPAASSLVSRFKNLKHHYFHQRSGGPVETFWGACGAIRRELFLAVDGFDEDRYVEPSVEDIELGHRLAERGTRIVLDPDLQVKHLKRWTLTSLVSTDVLRRAVPWTQLCLERGCFQRALNLRPEQRVAALIPPLALAGALVASVVGQGAWPLLATVLVALFALAVVLNRGFLSLLFRQGGIRLVTVGFFLLQLYYLYSLAGLAAGVVAHCGPWPRTERLLRDER